MGVTRVPLILVEFFHPSYNWTFRAHLGSLAILVCQKSYSILKSTLRVQTAINLMVF